MTQTDHGTPDDRWTARLSEFVDGNLSRRERRELQQHLGRCAACRAEVEELQRLVAQAPSLKADVDPSTDLWPGIAGRLGARPSSTRGEWLAWRPQGLVLRVAAVAAVLLLVATAVVTLVNRQHGQPARSTPPPETAERSAPAVESTEQEEEYARTAAALEREARDRLRLDPRLVGVLEENLATLDVAITNYREAVAAEPGDKRMRSRLDAARQRKLDVLRQAVTLSEGTN